MKLYERKMIQRVQKALDAAPGANLKGGSQSASVKGVVSYALDLDHIRSMLREPLYVLMDGSIEDAQRRARFEEAMKPVDAYIAARRAKSWDPTDRSEPLTPQCW